MNKSWNIQGLYFAILTRSNWGCSSQEKQAAAFLFGWLKMVKSSALGWRALAQVRPSAWKRLLTSELANLTTGRLRVATSWPRPFGVTSPLQEPTEANTSSLSESVRVGRPESSGADGNLDWTPNGTAAALKFGSESRKSRFGSAQSQIFKKIAFYVRH